MVIHSESASATHFEVAVALIGKAWDFPAEAALEHLDLILREKDVLRRLTAGEDARKLGRPM